MSNHKIEVNHWEKNQAISNSDHPSSNAFWNINNIHDARSQIRHIVGVYSRKGGRFIVKHNSKKVYDSSDHEQNPELLATEGEKA